MAIKVNGTTVINDSRQLQNVASVDATTVAAMGAAGVGGETTLLVDNANITSGTSYVEVSFTGGYQRYIVTLQWKRKSGYYGLYTAAQYTDSSGNLINTSNSHYVMFTNSNQTEHNGNYAYLNYSSLEFNFLNLDVRNPYEANLKTMTDYSFKNLNNSGTSTVHTTGAFWLKRGDTNARTNSLRVFVDSNGQMDSGAYSVWGVSS